MNYSELVIVKVGTGAISNADQSALDRSAIGSIGKGIQQLVSNEQVAVVLVSSGAFPAGIEQIHNAERVKRDVRAKQVATMVGNKYLFTEWEKACDMKIAFDLPTHNDLSHDEAWQNLVEATVTALSLDILPAFNEGDARSTEELEELIRKKGAEFKRFGDNDQLALRLGLKLAEDPSFKSAKTSFIFLSTVDGVMRDQTDTTSIYRSLESNDIEKLLSGEVDDGDANNGGMKSKLLAAQEATRAGHNVFIGNGKEKGSIKRLRDLEIGTFITGVTDVR